MRLFLDENLSSGLAALLAATGHDVVCANDAGLGGAADEDIWRCCLEQCRTLITLDSDFSDRRRFDPVLSAGIVWFRASKGQSYAELNCLVVEALKNMDDRMIRGKIAIVNSKRVRIR